MEILSGNFVERLKNEQVSCTIRENDLPGQKEEQKQQMKLFESFTFLCIVLAVVCNLIDYLLDGHIGWAWFVTAGAFCTWLMVSVAYVKRRNLLKNEMWQLVIAAVAGVLWDVFTGWRGWSVDYLLPLAALAVICSMWVITAVQKLEVAEYMILSSGSRSFRRSDPCDPAGCRGGDGAVSVADLHMRQFPDAGMAVSV